jgi:hypothetical protein
MNDEKVMQLAEQLQKECHDMADLIINKSANPPTFQDITNAYLYHKIAYLQLALQSLQDDNLKTQSYLNRNTPLI